MSYIGQIVEGSTYYPLASMLYGTCDTAADVATKVVTCPACTTLATGVTIHVKFTYHNEAGTPMLQVGSTEAIAILPDTCNWCAGTVAAFTYDGSNWIINTGSAEVIMAN